MFGYLDSRACDEGRHDEFVMYEDYFGFAEKPFSLTPDPKYLYRSESHANAFDVLHYAIRRREGFIVVTGDIGTGKTTLCRAVLEQMDRKTFTALVLNPFLSEEDLLKLILQDFGVVSREELKRGRLAGVSKQELIETLNEFLLSLLPLNANAVLIIDEAQNLPLQVLEQIRILSNLETDKEKLLQIVLVGQLNLQPLLRSPEVRQLDQRVSIRYELKPLNRREVAAYVNHRLSVAGGGDAVTFAPRALDRVHRLSGGIPRLINLLCDRALLYAFSVRAHRIVPDMVRKAADSLQLPGRSGGLLSRFRWRAAIIAAAIATSTLAGTAAAFVDPGLFPILRVEHVLPSPPPIGNARSIPRPSGPYGSPLAPAEHGDYTVLLGSFDDEEQVRALSGELNGLGYHVYSLRRRTGTGRPGWQMLVGRYPDPDVARHDEARLRHLPPFTGARVIKAPVVFDLEN